MISEPHIEKREIMHYAAIYAQTDMQKITKTLPPLIPEIYSWLKEHNVEPAGPVFFHYLSMNNGIMEVQVGVPVNSPVSGDGRVIPGEFPAGKYAVTRYTGNYMNLPKAHQAFEQWREKNNIKIYGTRTEFYLNDPEVETNPDKWVTEIVLYIAG